MQRAYLAISFSHRPVLEPVVSAIRELMNGFGIELFVFTDHYFFAAEQEKDMMKQAFKEIDGCELLIAECSEKAIGVGIEAGYALGRGKQVWYIRQENSPHSTTASGAAHKSFIYCDIDDLTSQMRKELHITG